MTTRKRPDRLDADPSSNAQAIAPGEGHPPDLPGVPRIGRLFVRNTASAILGTGLNVFVQGIYFLVLARALGPREYGAYAAVLALSRILNTFSSWGYGDILVKNASRDPGKFRAYWGLALLITMVGGVFSTLLVFVVSKVILNLTIPPTAIILICLADLLLGKTVSLCQQAYQAFEKMTRYAQVQAGLSILRLLGAISMGLFIPAPTALSWALLYFLTSVPPSIFGVSLVNRELGRFSFGSRMDTREILQGFYFSVSQGSQTMDDDIDKTLLASLSTLEITGFYTVAYRLIDFSLTPIRGLLASAYANSFKAGTAGIKGSLKWALALLPWASAFGLVASISLFALANLVPLFLGAAYNETALILRWLSPIVLFKSLQGLIADALTGSGHQGIRTGIHLGIASLNLWLCLWLIPAYSWFGAALASLASDGLAIVLFVIAALVLLAQEKRLADSVVSAT